MLSLTKRQLRNPGFSQSLRTKAFHSLNDFEASTDLAARRARELKIATREKESRDLLKLRT